MGPLVPDLITPELNLIVAFFIGIGFGFVLEQAGFSSAKVLTGLFYGTDFTVLRVFFTAGITAMSGVLLLNQFGLLDMGFVFINPLFLYPALVGGGIMGVGFVVGGYCPGTSLCAAAIGKLDAMFFVLGGLLGVFLFAEAFPFLVDFYQSGSLGDLTMDTVLGLSKGQFALALIVVATGAFGATSFIEKKINAFAPSKTFPVRCHRWAAVGILVLGLVFAIVPERETRLLTQASDPDVQAKHAVPLMTSDELAIKILDQDPRLEIIDVRKAADYKKMTLPGAVNIPVEAMLGKGWRSFLAHRHKKKVLICNQEAPALQAATLGSLMGYENFAVLKGGLKEFSKIILTPKRPSGKLTRQEQDTYNFRSEAALKMAALIRDGNKVKRAIAPVKKVQGGCGL